MDAIVYTSNTGYTAEYARLLSEATGLPAYSLSEAAGGISPGSEIIYLGWIMAGTVKGYKKAAKKYRIAAAAGVGMGETGSQTDAVRKTNAMPAELPLFVLQGGFDTGRLRGIYKLMMNIMRNSLEKKGAEGSGRTPDEDKMLDMMVNGSNYVSRENLADMLDWYHSSGESRQ